MHKFNFKKILKSAIFLFLICSPAVVFGANIFFETNNDETTIGSDLLVSVYIDTENQVANALSGKVIFDQSFFEVKEIRDGNSAINFWIEKPTVNQSGILNFSGVSPLGFAQDKNFVLSVVFKVKNIGESEIDFEDVILLKNDGEGSSLKVKKTPISLKIIESIDTSIIAPVDDKELPEIFKPEIAQDPEMFSGKYFLVFSTQDKGVGVYRYEIKEGFWGKYIEAESPYIIKDQSLGKKIYVKVIDRSMNERVVVFNPGIKWYQDYLLLSIMLVVIIAMILVLKKIWRRKFGYPRS